MTKDLTQGSPMRLILGFTLSTLLGLLFQQLYNVVDTMIVGKLLGAAALRLHSRLRLAKHLRPMLLKHTKQGILMLFYNCITLSPCFLHRRLLQM